MKELSQIHKKKYDKYSPNKLNKIKKKTKKLIPIIKKV